MSSKGVDVWHVAEGERLSISARHGLVVLFLVVLGVIVGTLGSFSLPGMEAISAFWPAMTIQALGAIWFGWWGVIAGILFPTASNFLVGGGLVNILGYLPSNFFQSFLPAWVFRRFRLDPRLKRKRDYIIFVGVVALLSNVLGAAIGVLVLYGTGAERELPELWNAFHRWVMGNSIPCILLGIPTMRVLSPVVVRTDLFCLTMWRSRIKPKQIRRRKFQDLPILIKLLVGFVLAGIVPMLGVAVMTIAERGKDVLAEAEQRMMHRAREISGLLERFVETEAAFLQEASLAFSVMQRDQTLSGRYLDRLRQEGANRRRLFLDEQAVKPSATLSLLRGPLPRSPDVEVFVVSDEDGSAKLVFLCPISPAKASQRYVRSEIAVAVFRRVLDQAYPDERLLIFGCEALLVGDDELARMDYFQQRLGKTGATWRGLDTKTVHFSPKQLALTIFVERSDTRVLQSVIAEHRSGVSALITLGIFAAIIVGGFLAHNIERPIERLIESVTRFGRGDLDEKIAIESQDEIGQLARAFDKMSDDLKRHVEELKQATAEKERIQTELDVAAALQRSLLPEKAPVVPNFEIAGTSIPALEVGGDYYGYIEFADGTVGIGIGDAAGKGLGAAMFVAACRAASISVAMKTQDLPTTLYITNKLLVQDAGDSGIFASFFASFLNPVARTLTYSNAGHNPPIVLRAEGGDMELLSTKGMLLGIDENVEFGQEQIILHPGDVVLYYTDGVTEAKNARSEFFGEERLYQLLRDIAGLSAHEIVKSVSNAVLEFTGPAPQYDDITIVALKAP